MGQSFLKYCMVTRESLRIASLQGDAQEKPGAYTDSRKDAKELAEDFWSGATDKKSREQDVSASEFKTARN